MKKKSCLTIILFLLLLITIVGCSSEPKNSTEKNNDSSSEESDKSSQELVPGDKLNIGFYGGALGDAFQEVFVKSFEEKYDVEVELVTAFDNVRFTQLATNKSKPNLDVAFFTDPMMPKVYQADLVEPLLEENIPNLADVYPTLLDEDKSVTFSYGVWGIIYNTEEIDKDIKSWGDLLSPEYKGKITAPGIQYNSSVLTLMAFADLNGGDIENLDPGFKGLKEVRDLSQTFWQSSSDLIGWLKQGEAWMSPYASGGSYELTLDPDAPKLKFIKPEEGIYQVGFNAIKVKNNSNAVGADLFINHVLDASLQEDWVNRIYYSPSNMKTKVPAELADIVISGDDVKDIIQVDWESYSAIEEDVIEKWQKEIN